jgi:DNA-binding MarR family transcriptional regulator
LKPGWKNKGIEDRRIFIVDLTPKGKPLAKKLFEDYLKLHKEIFSTIPASEYKSIAFSLEELLKAINEWLYSKNLRSTL